jgi:hypothetical protein
VRGSAALVTRSIEALATQLQLAWLRQGPRAYVHGRYEAQIRRTADEIGARGTSIVLAVILGAVACSNSVPKAPGGAIHTNCKVAAVAPSAVSPIRFTAGQVIGVPSDPANVAVADLNCDGKLDIAVASESEPFVGVLLGRGDGTFDRTLTIPAGHAGSFILAADLDGDGYVDLATSNPDGSATVLWGKGDGTFSRTVNYKVTGALATADAFWIAAADLNGDGALDLIVSVFGASGPDPSAPGQVAVLLNRGGRSFANPVFYADRAAVAVVAGDFDGDGKPDIATADFESSVSVFLGNGKGRLGPRMVYSTGGQAVAIAAGDFNGDGVLDLATGNDASGSVSVLPGIGHGSFGSPVTFEAGNTHSIAIVDLNRDGHLDLISGGYDENLIRFWPGQGDGKFLGEVRIPTSAGGARSVAAVDFNGDGKLDLAVADTSTSIHMFIGS